MKKILVILALAPLLVFAQFQSTNHRHAAEIIRVNDGDTVVISAPYLPEPLKKELSVRVWGIDTPEKGFRAKCAEEDRKGRAATAFTQELVSKAKTHQVEIRSWDKYGGRVLGDIFLDGQSLKDLLIKNNLARPYFGDAKKSWC